MLKRWLVNLALALLVIGLALLVWLRPGSDAGKAPALTDLPADGIRTIRIERPGQEEIRLEKTGRDWRLVAPLGARAGRHRVDNLLRVAGAEYDTHFAAAGQNLAAFGLDQPAARLWLDEEVIHFGAPHPLKNQRYVLYRDQIHLIAGNHFSALGVRPLDFVDTRLFEENRRPVAIALAQFALTLKEGSWQLQPADPEIGADRLGGFVDDWRHARALSVARDSGRAATAHVRIGFEEDGNTGTLELDILAEQPELILRRRDEGLEYHFPADIGRRLLSLRPDHA